MVLDEEKEFLNNEFLEVFKNYEKFWKKKYYKAIQEYWNTVCDFFQLSDRISNEYDPDLCPVKESEFDEWKRKTLSKIEKLATELRFEKFPFYKELHILRHELEGRNEDE